MALLEINLQPSRSELRWFGLIVLALFGMIGAVVAWQTGASWVPFAVIGAVLCAVYYAVPPIRRPAYITFMYAVLPIGWVVSHLLFGVIYFLVLTPIGFVGKLFGRDPLRLERDPNAATYWIDREPTRDPLRYFGQH